MRCHRCHKEVLPVHSVTWEGDVYCWGCSAVMGILADEEPNWDG